MLMTEENDSPTKAHKHKRILMKNTTKAPTNSFKKRPPLTYEPVEIC
jgi:hypothetical protein